jgi:peptide-methionine (S)-S-oxide reductase
VGLVQHRESGHLVLRGTFARRYVDVDEALHVSERGIARTWRSTRDQHPPGGATMVFPVMGIRSLHKPNDKEHAQMTTEKAILAGGCFWGMQDLIRKLDGVVSTRVGYSGGDVPNATYRNHGTHAEAIEIVFDPERISYRDLLEFFFQVHDPSTKNRQGNDIGTSYRSAIFYLDDEQRRVAEDTIADVDASGLWPGKVVTEVEPAGPFWEAEPEHQDYLERYPNGYTCHFVRPGWRLPKRAEKTASYAG